MATSDELQKQLKLAQQLNAVMQQIATNQQAVEKAASGQVGYVQRVVQMMQQLQNSTSDEKFKSLSTALNEAAERASSFDDDPLKNIMKGAEGASDQFETLAKRLSNAGKKAGIFGVAMVGLKKGFQNFLTLSKSTLGFFAGIVEWVGSVAASIIAIPLRILEGLVNLAASSTFNMIDLRREIELVREQFGDLKGPGSAAIFVATRTLQGFADTGLRAWRVFGTLAQRLEHFRKLATSMGATFSVLTQEFVENGGALAAFQKGLGASGDEMKALGARSITFGKQLGKTLLDVAKQSLSLGKQFGLDQKLIARDMAKATINVRHFGTVTVKEIGVAATYARKLGVELDKITGTLDAFETFDTAAENAAKLSQSFGVQVDAFKLMAAQNPAEQIDMLRKQFRIAGVDASGFNRQQLRLLATTTGLDEAIAQQVFSQKNFGVSLDDVRKQSEGAEKQQLSQAEAMSKLADSIERMVKEGPALQGSFFRTFIDGMMRGIQSTKDFRDLMFGIRRALYTTMRAGVAFGRIFVGLFPGVQATLEGLKDLFSPKKFGALGEVINDATKALLDKKKPISIAQFADRIFGGFGAFIESEKGPFKAVVEGFKTFFIGLADKVGPAVSWAGARIGEFLGTIADFLTGKRKIGTIDLTAGDQFLLRFFKPIFEGFEEAWKSIKPHAVRLLVALGDKLVQLFKSPEAQALGWKVAPYVAAIVFGPAVVNALVYAGSTALIKGISGAALSALSGTGGLTKLIVGPIGRLLGAATAVIFGAINISDAMDKYKKNIESEFGETNAIIGTGAAGVIDTLTLGLLPDEWIGDVSRTVAGWSQKLDVIFGDGLFGSVLNVIKNNAAKIYEFIGFTGTAIKNALGTWSDLGGKKGEKTLSVEDAKKRASQGFFGSVLQIGEDFGNDLADKVLGDRNKALKQVGKGLEKGGKSPVPSPTVPTSEKGKSLLGDVGISDASLPTAGDVMQNLSKQLAKAQVHIAKIKEQAPKIAAMVKEGGVKTALTAVRDVVAMVQELDDALSRTPQINVATRLGNLATSAGLGSRAQYTVTSKPVQLNLSLSVVMEAGELEKVIVMRSDSIIRDRLEFATIKAPGQQGNNSLPETYTKNVPSIAKR